MIGMDGEQTAQGNRERQHPLAHRHLGDDMVHQMGRGLGHSPRAARRADAAPLTGKGHQFLLLAAIATKAQKAVREDAAGQKRVELVGDKREQEKGESHANILWRLLDHS